MILRRANFPKTIIIALILLITHIQASACDTGCLSCDPKRNVCNLCDGINGYIKNNDLCVKKLKDNCFLVSSEGQCLQCVDGFYLQNGNCIANMPNMENSCSIYQTSKACKPSSSGVFFYDMIFNAVYKVIEGCVEYSDATTCKKCQANLSLSYDRRSCLAPSIVVENCLSYSNFICLECAKGYFYDQNSYTLMWKNFTNGSSIDQFFASYIIKNNTGFQNQGVSCVKETVLNCKKYLGYDRCEVCQDGYFLDSNKKCQINPLPSIENCMRYNQYLQCEECKQGFYLKQPFLCAPVETIINCQSYEGSTSYVKCVMCQDAYYLTNPSPKNYTCLSRSASLNIPNCSLRAYDKDICSKCNDSYETSLDGTFCFKVPSNCQTYTKPKIESELVTCSTCEAGYILTTDGCVKGQISNCKIYENGICKTCEFGYTISNQKCVQITNKTILENCLETDPVNQNLCMTCDINSDMFTIKYPCISVKTPIPHCIKYDSVDVCSQCETGYQLNAQSSCVKIDPNTLCLSYDNQGNCSLCKTGYYLTLSGECAPYLELFYYNCDEIEELANGVINCLTCNSSSTPVIIDGLVNVCQSPYDNNNALAPTIISNCKSYNSDQSCQECEDTYLLMESDGTCKLASQCTTGIILERIDEINGLYSVTGKNICRTIDSVANCKYYGTNFERDNVGGRKDYVCIACKDTYYSEAPLASGEAHIYDQTTSSTDFTYRKPSVSKCTLKTTADQTNYISQGDLTNCAVVNSQLSQNYNTATTYYGCYQCKFGYTGKPTLLDTKYFIPFCSKITDCDSSITYSGLSGLPKQIMPLSTNYPNLPFEGFLTCHKCIADDKIPVFAATEASYTVKTNISITKNDLVGFRLSQAIPVNSENSGDTSQEQTQCLSISYIISLGNGNFPEKCAAAMVLVNKTKTLYLNANTSILCIACSPGYKATQIDANTYPNLAFAVQSCTKINNCKSSTRFNGCSECENGYALAYDSILQRPILDLCVSTHENCLYGTGIDNKCAICKHGYFLHSNGHCFVADFKNCNIFNVRSLYNYKTSSMSFPRQMDFLLSQSGFSFGSGCLKCDSSYSKIQKIFSNQRICMKNPIITSNSLLGSNLQASYSDSGFISNCQNYYYNTAMKCKKCIDSYIISANNDACYFRNSDLLNCDIALSSTVCQKCSQGYILTNNNSCELGKIINCSIYLNESVCQTCVYGHILYNNACYLIPDINCGLFDFSQMISSKTISCQKCKSFYFSNTNTQSSSENLQICLPFDKRIDNCDNMIRDANGRLTCTICKAGYYLHNNKNLCLKRKSIPNCESFHPTDDYCQKCLLGYMLSPNFDECLLNPQGILYCVKYKTETECLTCAPSAYLSNNKCLKLPDSVNIESCVAYEELFQNSITCVTCESRSLLDANNRCVIANAHNCVTYSSINACATCVENFELRQNDDGITSCVEKIIPHCIRYIKKDEKVNCEICDNQYYLASDTECRKASKIISGCAFYDSNKNICRKCAPGKILSGDMTRCQDALSYGSLVPKNCHYIQFVNNPVCQECKPGFYFDLNGNCAKCETEENCLYCDPVAPKTCLLCKPGNYQGDDMKCIRHIEVIPETNRTNENPSVVSFIKLLTAEAVLILIQILS